MLEDDAWSVSRLKLLGECGYKFRLKYIDEVEEGPSVYFSFGRAVHETIEELTKGRVSAWQDIKAYEIWRERWTENAASVDWTHHRKGMYDKLGPQMIANYIKMDSDLGGEIIMNEWEFPSEDFNPKIGKHAIKGKIDQVRRIGKELVLIDFKTSSKVPLPLVLRADVQFTMYWQCVNQYFGETPEMYWAHLKTGELLPVHRKLEDLKLLEDMLDEGWQKVSLEMFSRNLGWHCGLCPYMKPCLETLS